MKYLKIALLGLLFIASPLLAEMGPRRVLFGGNQATSILPASMQANPPDIFLNFQTNQAYVKSTNSIGLATSFVNVSRASPATQVDVNGNWTQFSNNVLARSNQGAAIWESRTNGLRNNTMQGAVPGTPGTLPTNWVDSGQTTRTVVGTGTDSGINYIDVNVTLSGAGTYTLQFDNGSSVAATYGQTWTSSFFVSVVGGSTTNISTFQNLLSENTSGGSFLAATTSNFTPGNGTGVLGLNRFSLSRTVVNSTAGAVINAVRFNCSGAVNITLRIGWPQLEANPAVLSNVTSATTAAGGTGGTAGTAVYSVGGGTLANGNTAATLNVTVSGGAITAINSVATPGGYSVFPTSPAALTYVSGTGSGVTGATVNLTPVNNAAFGIASPPILTVSTAVNRLGDNVSLILTGLPSATSAATLFANSVIQAPLPGILTVANGNRYLLELSDGEDVNNRILMFGSESLGTSQGRYSVSAANTSLNGTAITTGSVLKTAIAGKTGDQVLYQSGVLKQAASSTGFPSGLNDVRIGVQAGTSVFQLAGNMNQIAIWFTQRVPNSQLQNMTQ